MRRLSLILIFSLVLLWALPAPAQGSIMEDIASKLVCQCGCNSALNNCVHQECTARVQMYTAIRTLLAQGKTGPEIIQALVGQYGEKVLAAPTKRGFNLTAWITPIIALLAGGGVLALVLRSWMKKGREAPEEAAPVSPEEEERYRRRLEQELRKFGEGMR